MKHEYMLQVVDIYPQSVLMILKPFQHDHKNRPYVRVNAM